jgi:anthraniloyl-CoA monooxygenase
MNITILGAGPAGLYCGLLIKKSNPSHNITIIERNPADVTYGWGVVFSDRTLASFQRADYKTYEQIRDQFVIWDSIYVRYRGETIRCGGHVIASISRKRLLNILQQRCDELGISLRFSQEINDLADLPQYDLLIASDGLNSIVRKTYVVEFKPNLALGKARYIWFGADKVLDAFTFIFRENEHGLFQVHAYPFSGTLSTFIVECDESTWLNAGLDKANEAQSIAYCKQLFSDDLDGSSLLSNNSKWISFPTLKTQHWHHRHIVLLGDAVHTAHFSIGSGTKLAMEDAIALAAALDQHSDLETALSAYELERKPVVEVFQRAAQESQTYFETIKRYLNLDPMQFTFQLLTRSGRITYDDLRLRDPHFGDAVNRWYMYKAGTTDTLIAPPPMFAPMKLRNLTLPTRVVLLQSKQDDCWEALGGIGLVMAPLAAISAEARITPEDSVLYNSDHVTTWAQITETVHMRTSAKIAIQLGHAGRRGSTRPRSQGLDRPLHSGNWPLIAASPIPYTSSGQVPKEMDHADMQQACQDFTHAAQLAEQANFDLLQLHFAHGYLLASFLSPLTNQRHDQYGGDLQNRMRFPLEIFDAVRAIWPQHKPISVALSVNDYTKHGLTIEDAIIIAKTLKAHGCDLIHILAGQTTPDSHPSYTRGFLTPLSDRVRNEAGIPTLAGGYLTTSDEVNTILAAGRADLCIFDLPFPSFS